VIILFEAMIYVIETLAGAVWLGAQTTIESLISSSFGGNFWVIMTVLAMVFCTWYVVTYYR